MLALAACASPALAATPTAPSDSLASAAAAQPHNHSTAAVTKAEAEATSLSQTVSHGLANVQVAWANSDSDSGGDGGSIHSQRRPSADVNPQGPRDPPRPSRRRRAAVVRVRRDAPAPVFNESRRLSPPPSTPAAPLLRLAATAASVTFIRRATQQYEITRPELPVTVVQLANSHAAISALEQGQVDASFSSLFPTAAELERAPDLVHLPLWAYAYAPVANVPANGEQPVVLSVPLLCRIFRGNVTHWNDPALLALNAPLRSAGADAGAPIEVVLMDSDMNFLADFTQLCGSVDAEFAALIPRSSSPDWPRALYNRTATVSEITGQTSHVIAHPGSIALVLNSIASKFGAKIASMRNSAGVIVRPTYFAIDSAVRERAVAATRQADGRVRYVYSGDLSNAPGKNSWPLAAGTMMAISRSFTRTSCRARSELIKLLKSVEQAGRRAGGPRAGGQAGRVSAADGA